MEDEAELFLLRFVKEFPATLKEDKPLPISPLSCRVTFDELHGECLEFGTRLLAEREGPALIGALMCHAALDKLLQKDLSAFHCSQEVSDEEDPPSVLFKAEKVQHLFLNKLIEVAITWYDTLPKLPGSSSQLLQSSVYAIRNTRRKMEDKHVALAEFNQLFGFQDDVNRSYFAVFDGHGGVDAASYAATHLHVVLSQQETLTTDAATAFKSAFKRTDDMFKEKSKRERLRSGTTGVAVLIQGSELTVSWLGDSQAIMVRDGQLVKLMDPHKPEREDEKQRIEDLGGCIAFMGCWRVNGTYAVSRAIGDYDQKPYISSDADCATIPLKGDEDYLLLACDGFFDAIQPTEVPQLVMTALEQAGEPKAEGHDSIEPPFDAPGLVAQHLVAEAKAAGSTDNITVMLVFLRPPEQFLSQDSPSQDSPTENPDVQEVPLSEQ